MIIFHSKYKKGATSASFISNIHVILNSMYASTDDYKYSVWYSKYCFRNYSTRNQIKFFGGMSYRTEIPFIFFACDDWQLTNYESLSRVFLKEKIFIFPAATMFNCFQPWLKLKRLNDLSPSQFYGLFLWNPMDLKSHRIFLNWKSADRHTRLDT